MDTTIYHPDIFTSESRKIELTAKDPSIEYVDVFERQIKELFLIDNKEFIGIPKGDVYESDKYRAYFQSKRKEYVYVHYPWLHIIVKSVKDDDFISLKTNRNRDLITAKEQVDLHNYRIAVLGMSVGSNIAHVLTQAGISNKIILADFDELETTNLNRIWAGLHQVGLNKTIIAARKIYEGNPFAEVSALVDGITTRNLEQLLKNKKIDCIVEEIDNIELKIQIRKLAVKYKVPVLMYTDNGDWGVLHVERYDLGYKKVFDKSAGYWDERITKLAGKKDFADIVINDIVGGVDKVDPKMIACAGKVANKELVSWPQLGSSAILGGVVVNLVVKNIVTGRDKRLFVREYIKILE